MTSVYTRMITTESLVTIHHHSLAPSLISPALQPSLPLITTYLFSVSVNVFLFRFICSFVFLKFHKSEIIQFYLSLIYHNILKVCSVVVSGNTSFFLWLSNIPLCIYTTSSLSIHPLVNILVVSISWLL